MPAPPVGSPFGLAGFDSAECLPGYSTTLDTALNRLDPRRPFVLDTRELGRRPGSMRRMSRVAPAPADLGIAVLGVPKGSDLALELRLESVMDGVLVSGSARAMVAGECVRCLDPLQRELEADFQELFVYPGTERDSNDGVDEDEVFRLEGDLLDLEPVVRDAVVLALPLAPVCAASCAGLCPDCGARLADDPADGGRHEHGSTDTRWAVLQDLKVHDRTVLDDRTDKTQET